MCSLFYTIELLARWPFCSSALASEGVRVSTGVDMLELDGLLCSFANGKSYLNVEGDI